MFQSHKRSTDEQVRVLLQSYGQGKLSRVGIQELLDIGKTRFFALMKSYRQNPEAFSIGYKRSTSPKLSDEAEAEIEKALLEEKVIVEDPDLLISGYNYSTLRDRLRKKGVQVSVTTIVDRAKKLGCHKPRRKRRVHDRETCTYEKLSTLDEVRSVMRDEIYCYNRHQVHSTTQEIPNIRFEIAIKEGNSLFSKFAIPEPYSSPQDVFCLGEKRTVNGYHLTCSFRIPFSHPRL